MSRAFGLVIVAALLASMGAVSTAVIKLSCHGAVDEDPATDFVIAIDVTSSVITEGNFRWTATDGDATIDWNLHRQNGALRGVVLTGADAGAMIAGECDQSAERKF